MSKQNRRVRFPNDITFSKLLPWKNVSNIFAQFFSGKRNTVWQRVAKNFSITFIGSVVLIAIGLGRTAILTKSLTLDDYGRLLIVINLFLFLGAFLSVRVSDVIYRFYPQFKQQGDVNALRGLIALCFILTLAVGLIIGGGVYTLAPWIARKFYQDPTLAILFRVYAGAAIISAFSGIYTPILRLHYRFLLIMIPQILGGVSTLTIVSVNLYRLPYYHIYIDT